MFLFLLRLFFALLIIILIVPQTPYENIVLRILHETGFFSNYGETKFFLNFITWFSIIVFLILTLFSSFFN